MPVRLRITLLFTVLVFFILGLVCSGIYYSFYKTRINNIKTRLTNRAITTGRLLSEQEIFHQSLIKKVDSLTALTLKDKVIQAYDYQNNKLYSYSDVAGDTIQIDKKILEKVKENENYYFTSGDKEAIAYHYTSPNAKMIVVSAAEDEDGKRHLRNLFNILLFSFLIGNLLVLVTGYFFSKGLLLPIKKISQEVAEISARNLTRRINTGPSKDEWHRLSSTFNELLDRLQEGFELQQQFVANASHELSTPLTSISSQLEVAMQRKRDAEEYLKVMQSVHQDVRHLSTLTQTLLEFAKASGSPGGLETNLIRIDEVVLKLPSEVTKIGGLCSVKLAFHDLPEVEEKLLVYGNEALLFSAIKNIVVNACKYSPDYTATVHLRIIESNVQISIEDSGMGIPEKEIKNIFQPFYRGEGSRSTSGVGLGLALAERIIKIHEGYINVESKVEQGTIFTVTLPCAGTKKPD